MLNGSSPIFLFNFLKNVPGLEAEVKKIPVVSDIVSKIGLPPIPLYLDEQTTGIYIASENKNVDIETVTETLKNGETPISNQKGISSIVTINMFANKDSVGLNLLSALVDVIFNKVSSKDYTISYLHGPITVFDGLLHQFSANQNNDNDLLDVQIQLVRANQNQLTGPPIVNRVGGTIELDNFKLPARDPTTTV